MTKLLDPKTAAQISKRIAEQRIDAAEQAMLDSAVWKETYVDVLLRTAGNATVARNMAKRAYLLWRNSRQQATQSLHSANR